MPSDASRGVLTNLWEYLLHPWDHTLSNAANQEHNRLMEMTASRRRIATRFLAAAHGTGPRTAGNLIDRPDDSEAGRTATIITAALTRPHHPLAVLRAVAVALTRIHNHPATVDAAGRLDLGAGTTVTMNLLWTPKPTYLLHHDGTRPLDDVQSGDPATTAKRILRHVATVAS